jgi:hypothetical protein
VRLRRWGIGRGTVYRSSDSRDQVVQFIRTVALRPANRSWSSANMTAQAGHAGDQTARWAVMKRLGGISSAALGELARSN